MYTQLPAVGPSLLIHGVIVVAASIAALAVKVYRIIRLGVA
jgi:hypothetical protein